MKAIIFDCDGVLVDSEVIYKTSERLFLQNVGLFYETQEFFRRFMGRSEESFFAEAGADHEKLHGRPLPHDFKKNLLAHQNAEFERNLTAIPGMKDLVESMVGLPIAVASSSPTEALNFKLQKTAMDHYFGNHIYSARMVAHGKPEPDLFLFAAKNINFEPKDCIVIEDSGNGVIAGLRAGMTVIGFTGGGHCPEGHDKVLLETGAHYIANDTDELKIIINGLLTHAPDERSFLA